MLALFIAALLSGCLMEPEVEGAEVFVLEYAIIDLEGDPEGKTAEPGFHCQDVQKDDGKITIGLWPDEDQGDAPFLAIFPELPENWASTSSGQPTKTTFPATVDPRVEEDPTLVGELEWEPMEDGENGTMRLDGDAVSLPHSWSVSNEDGSWRADATLVAWRGPVEYDRYSGYCD